MFFREAVLKCSQLEQEVAQVYTQLAASAAAMPETADAWKEVARKENLNSRMLRAVADLSTALEDDGPFLVQIPVQLRNLRRVLDNVKHRLTATIDEAAGKRCAEALENAQRSELHAGLLEIAGPEVQRLLRLIDAEIKMLRRTGSGTRSRKDPATEKSCARTGS